MGTRSQVAAVLLIGVGVALLSGCLYVPMFGTTVEGKDVSGRVGSHDSGRPLRVGGATRAEVAGVLGPPDFTTPDAARVAYTWKVLHGSMRRLTCGPVPHDLDTPHHGVRALLLEFDAGGVLRTFEVARYDGEPGERLDVTFVIPTAMRPWHERGGSRPAASAGTRPTSRP